jgi:HEAT repeat protein
MSPTKKSLAALAAALPAAASPVLGQTVPPATAGEEKKRIEVLKSDAPLKEKMDACRQLGVIGSATAVPALAELLGDEKLSHMARYALEPIPDAAVDKALREALGQLKGRPLVGVIGSVGVRRDARAVKTLAGLLDEDDPDVVQTAARSLGRIATPEAASALKARMATAPEAARCGVADGCLSCAENIDDRKEAAALCEAVVKADVPEHVRAAARKTAEAAR